MNKKILLVISAILVIIIATVSIYQTLKYQNNAHQSREYSFIEILSEKTYSNEQQLIPCFDLSDSIVNIIQLTNDSKDNKESLTHFLKLLENNEHIESLYILDSLNNCKYSSENNTLKPPVFTTCPMIIKKRDRSFYLAKNNRTQKYGIYYIRRIEKDSKYLGSLIAKITTNSFSTEMKWERTLPSEHKSDIYNGIVNKDLILLTTSKEKLYHLSSISNNLTKRIEADKQYSKSDIINLKLLDKNYSFNYLANHRILHRKNIYKEDYVILSTPILNGDLIQVHIIPHTLLEQYFDNKGSIIENIFKLLSAPFLMIILLMSVLIFSTISYKRIISDLINTSNLKVAEAAVAGIEKDEFLATVTHELRTPLNGVMGITTLLRDTEPTEKQMEYLNMIDSCSTSLLKTVNDVLDISKIRSGILTINKKPFNLPVLVHEIVTPIEKDAHKKDLSFFVDQSKNVPEWVEGDAERIKQILECFLSNAVKFTDVGSVRFTIDTEEVNKDTYTFTFTISDTGIGISQEDQEKMFETFTQAEMSTTRVYGGMGLGLSIAKNLSDLMNGEITLKSILGKGSSFSLTIKLKIVDMIENNNEEHK